LLKQDTDRVVVVWVVNGVVGLIAGTFPTSLLTGMLGGETSLVFW
jgi:hypothetical protein